MGQEESVPIAEGIEPQTLESRTLEGVASYLKSGRAKRVVVLTGAGISTSAGIPDFRSPNTGLYANLARLNLPFAEAVFDISYFRAHPEPFYALAHELYPGKYRPTITHSFISMLHKKGLLLHLFTQNIDCLEREAGVPADLIVEAHGSFATQRCIDCRKEYPDNKMSECIGKREVPHCEQCNGLVKPDIVFFGEGLPPTFFERRTLPGMADLCIILGTSLSVHPFASLPSFVQDGVPRLLINKERVGGLGSRSDDVLELGDCDAGVRKLAAACGWLEELEGLWAETVPKEAMQLGRAEERTKDEQLQDEVDQITKDVEQTLKLASDNRSGAKSEIEKMLDKQMAKQTARQEMVIRGPRIEVKGESSSLAHVFPHLQDNLGS